MLSSRIDQMSAIGIGICATLTPFWIFWSFLR